MWGLYGLVYTAIGVAHAMQGPRRKWRPRIVLLTLALGLTAAAHLLAAMIGFVAAVIFMMYLAERRRSYVMQILIFSALGALFVIFASYAFRLQPFSYIFTGGSARFWFSLQAVRSFVTDTANVPTLIALAVAGMLYLGVRRCRYFGNTAPLIMASGDLPHRHNADGYAALALGAAVPVHIPRRRLCRRPGIALPQALPRAHGPHPRHPGRALPHPAARHRSPALVHTSNLVLDLSV